MKTKVIFICIHNSARSQMAEMFLNDIAGDKFEAKSAGLEAGKLNPFVVKAMAEIGIDMSGNKTKTVMEILESGESFDYVITVCDKEAAERCPLFPGKGEKLHWGFEDPSSFKGTDDEKLAFAKKVRDQIKAQLVTYFL